jgi:hypothetical protein
VYKLTCPDCGKAYIGQTDRNFAVRFREHKQAFRNNRSTSNFAKHLNEHNHSFGTIDTTMQILQHHRKSAHLNTLERFYIHKAAATDNHLNDEHTVLPNKIFDAITRIENTPSHIPHHNTQDETTPPPPANNNKEKTHDTAAH